MKKLFISLLVLAVVTLSCGATIDTNTSTQSNYEYSVFYVEGMPCMVILFPQGVEGVLERTGGVTCDWSQWNGE